MPIFHWPGDIDKKYECGYDWKYDTPSSDKSVRVAFTVAENGL